MYACDSATDFTMICTIVKSNRVLARKQNLARVCFGLVGLLISLCTTTKQVFEDQFAHEELGN